MRRHLFLSLLFATAAPALAQIPSPERPVTDPRSLASPENPDARPVPLDDIGMTRALYDVIWSADGKQLFVATDITGRVNIWRMAAEGSWPSFVHHPVDVEIPEAYGLLTPGEGVKVGFHGVGEEVDPDARRFEPVRQRELAAYVREWFPGLDPGTATPISCTYTSTPDEAFVLDRRGRVVVGAGFSGQGFKFAPGVGATLADLVLDPDLDPAASVAEAFRLR